MINSLKTDDTIYAVAKTLTDEEIQKGNKPPKFRIGDVAEVIGKDGFQIIGRRKKQEGFAIMCINISIKKKM